MEAVINAIITALKDTPIPTILVVAGIVFLLLSIAGRLAGRIDVPPERQMQAAIIGGLLLVVGVALHVAQPLRTPSKSLEVPPAPQSELPSGKTPSSAPETPPSTSSFSPPPDPEKRFPTKYAGVMARIPRFGTSGAFITLELALKNDGKKAFLICSSLQKAQLSDQDTGDSWEPVSTGGSLSNRCAFLEPSHETGACMQFKIPNPDKRVFLLNSDLFNQPVEHLAIGKSP